MSFPEIGPAHAPEIENFEKKWMSFYRNRSVSRPGKLKFGKIYG